MLLSCSFQEQAASSSLLKSCLGDLQISSTALLTDGRVASASLDRCAIHSIALQI